MLYLLYIHLTKLKIKFNHDFKKSCITKQWCTWKMKTDFYSSSCLDTSKSEKNFANHVDDF